MGRLPSTGCEPNRNRVVRSPAIGYEGGRTPPTRSGSTMDRDLVVRARGGDRDAFARLAAAAITRLDAVARVITRDQERARDAVQEALARAWRDLPSLRDPDRFDAWLRRLVVRACIDELRHARRTDHRGGARRSSTIPSVGNSSLTLADRDALEHAFRRLDPVGRCR